MPAVRLDHGYGVVSEAKIGGNFGLLQSRLSVRWRTSAASDLAAYAVVAIHDFSKAKPDGEGKGLFRGFDKGPSKNRFVFGKCKKLRIRQAKANSAREGAGSRRPYGAIPLARVCGVFLPATGFAAKHSGDIKEVCRRTVVQRGGRDTTDRRAGCVRNAFKCRGDGFRPSSVAWLAPPLPPLSLVGGHGCAAGNAIRARCQAGFAVRCQIRIKETGAREGRRVLEDWEGHEVFTCGFARQLRLILPNTTPAVHAVLVARDRFFDLDRIGQVGPGSQQSRNTTMSFANPLTVLVSANLLFSPIFAKRMTLPFGERIALSCSTVGHSLNGK